MGGHAWWLPWVPDPHNPLIRDRKFTDPTGHLRQLAIIAEEDVLILYADQLPARRFRATVGEGRDYGLDFYHYAAPQPGAPRRWTWFNPHSPPWVPGFYRTHAAFLEGLEDNFRSQLDQHITKGLSEAAPYVDLKLEQGELPPPRLRFEPRPGKQEVDLPSARDLKRHWTPFQEDLLKRLEEGGRYLLVGDVGSGKTTLLLWLGWQLAKREGCIPFYLNLRDLGRRLSYKALSRKFREFCDPLVPTMGRSRLFEELWDTGRLVFLLDGLDQMPASNYPAVVEALLPIAKVNGLLLATRRTPARDLEDRQELKFLQLQPLDQAAKKAYFGYYYNDAMVLVSQAPDLPAVPMLAYLVRELLATGKALRVKTRTDLYGEFIDHVFDRERRLPLKDKEPGVRITLQALAFHSLAGEPPQFSYADYKIFEKHNEGRVKQGALLGFGLVNALVEREKGAKSRLFFTHQSFQEYLAAVYAWENPGAKNRVLDQMWQPRWREVLKFMVGMDRKGEVLKPSTPARKRTMLFIPDYFWPRPACQKTSGENRQFFKRYWKV